MFKNLTEIQIVGIGIVVDAILVSIIYAKMVLIWHDVEKRKWQRMVRDARIMKELKEKDRKYEYRLDVQKETARRGNREINP